MGKSIQASIAAIRAAADDILSSNAASSEREELLSRYVALLNEWFQDPPASDSLAAEARGDLEDLAEKHERVLKIATELRGEISLSLKELRVRGKGLMAYVTSAVPGVKIARKRRGI